MAHLIIGRGNTITSMATPSYVALINSRPLSTSAAALGKRNFRKFLTYGKRGTRYLKKDMRTNPDPELEKVFDRGVRPVGVVTEKKFKSIPEMIPEIIVPDLNGFKKPYVSYKVPDVIQGSFGPQDLFYAVYSDKIAEDVKNNKLNEDGSPAEPSEEELLTADEAKKKALSIGSDMY
ncbi:39S ribosomal protein L41, mitochondrial-like isoform X2 [Homarus americanus]|uniref:39S ribosomal protein L41, mitochondrial-like isoform X2 n=1 Tax=Homarus americanus TaxID=6706 RepID=UPI001C447BE3|nr:39S ribosomal protein L41, mitochondrial-like isoform X2 [Homarus americanus]